MNALIQLKQTTSLFLAAFGLACFAVSPAVQAVSPPPPGGYPNFTTARGGPRPSGSHVGPWEHSNWYVFVV